MNASFYQSILAMLAGIAVILFLTVKYRIPAFFALLIASFVTALGVGIMPIDTVVLIKDGFAGIMKSLSLIIILGTTLGVLLENNGSTRVMADYILKKTGARRPAWAMSIAGFVIGLPIFCDSGYIVLSGLNRQLAKRTGVSIIPISVSLATGLYSVHCLVPPHPGAAAAAATLGVDFGKLILFGTLIAIPAMLVGHAWAVFAGRKFPTATNNDSSSGAIDSAMPSTALAFMPVLIPILLIASKSFLAIEKSSQGAVWNVVQSLGDPVIALSIGVLLAFLPKSGRAKGRLKLLLEESIEKAGPILVIIGAGGAFGAVLAATKPGDHFSALEGLKSLGILFPFLLTMVLKTAQGSSTVAIITASSIVLPLLPLLGLESTNGRLLCVLSMGAGSMLVSHANDAYFWVIVKFSGLDMKTVLKVYSLATCFMGITAMLMIYLLSIILA